MYFSARTEGRISYGHLGRTNLFTFYRATLCVSAVFVSPGVRLSVTFVYSMQTAKDIAKLLS